MLKDWKFGHEGCAEEHLSAASRHEQCHRCVRIQDVVHVARCLKLALLFDRGPDKRIGYLNREMIKCQLNHGHRHEIQYGGYKRNFKISLPLQLHKSFTIIQ